MGMFDTFFREEKDGKKAMQLKNGQCGLNKFYIGDKVDEYGYEDGIYLENRVQAGYVVVFKGIFGFRQTSAFLIMELF